MIKEAIDRIVGMAKDREIQIKEIHKLPHTINDLKAIVPPDFHAPESLLFHSLEGFAQFVTGEADRIDAVHVLDYSSVYAVGDIQPDNYNRRFEFAKARLEIEPFRFGRWVPLEDFVIAIMSQFVQSKTTENLLTWLGNLANESVVDNKDDGFSQSIQIRTGIIGKSKVKIENPLTMQPYRTFLEVDQPESECVFRVNNKDGMQCALHIADGGLWKVEAVKRIKAWLADKVNVQVL